MRRVIQVSCVFVCCILLAGCQLTAKDTASGAGPDAANPITGDAIAVTPLGGGKPPKSKADAAKALPDLPVGGLVDASADAIEVAGAKANPPADAPDVVRPLSQLADLPQSKPEADPAATEPAQEVLKTPGQIACERKGGVYANAGNTGAKACVKRTRDAGKQCKREKDCEGVCLARSRTCAPVKPLFGCNEILQNDGRKVNLCID